MRWVSLAVVTLFAGCASNPQALAPKAPAAKKEVVRDKAAPVEPVVIDISAKRSGQSLVVDVRGLAKGHQSGQTLENANAWRVQAVSGSQPLKQVLAGPAKVAREPAGHAMGDQWNVEVSFMVAFALPTEISLVEVEVSAPTGERRSTQIEVAEDAALALIRH